MRNQVDVVVTASEQSVEFEQCITSLLKYTNFLVHKLVVFSNASIDCVRLEHFNKENIILVNNGARRGMEDVCQYINSAKNDVVILHSDVIVTEYWLQKLYKCAYSDEAIGTVSPILCNYKNYVSFSKEVERISFKAYPQISCAEKKCFYIKRTVLNEVGMYGLMNRDDGTDGISEILFGVNKFGYYHALADDTLLYDKEAKLEHYINTNLTDETIDYQNIEKVNDIIENIRLFKSLNLHNGKRNILYFLLADFQENSSNNIGGTQFHVKDLVKAVKSEFNIFVVARDKSFLRVTAYIEDKVVPFLFFIGKVPQFNVFFNRTQRMIYNQLLKAFEIDLLHVHHTMWLSLDIYYEAQRLGIPIIITVHDYYYVCPILKLINLNKEVCVGNDSDEMCAGCLLKEKKLSDGKAYIKKWRYEHNKVLNMSRLIVFPSNSAAEIFIQYYPDVKNKYRIIPHGIDMDALMANKKGVRDKNQKVCFKKLRVAFIGGISEIKGGKIIYELICNAPKDKYEWYIFGGIGYEALYNLKQRNLTKGGWYKKEELFNLLSDNMIDIICLLSMVPETFCYTLSEAVSCKVPVIVTDIGALGERVRNMKCGWTVSANSTFEEIMKLLEYIRNNPDEYLDKYYSLQNVKVQDIWSMGQRCTEIYNSLTLKKKQYSNFDREMLLEGYYAAIDNNDKSIRIEKLQNELDEIKKSFDYKVIMRIRDMNNPVIRKVKKILKKLVIVK